MAYALYYATAPAPKDLSTHDALTRLVPVHFSTEKDAIHAAALVIRGGQFVWLIEGPAKGLEVHRAGIDFGERRGITGPVLWTKGETLWMLYALLPNDLKHPHERLLADVLDQLSGTDPDSEL